MGWPFSGYDGLIEKVYLPYFNKYGEDAIPHLCNSSVARMALLSAYRDLPPIEQMPEKEKKEMKLYVINMFPDKTVEEKLVCCKIIYTLGTIL